MKSASARVVVFVQECIREAVMQDTEVENWRRESQVPAELLLSLRGLNHRFLKVIAAPHGEWDSGQPLCGTISSRIAALSDAQKAAAANCPYALFDLRFHDDAHWRTRLRAPAAFVSEATSVNPDTLEFVRLALFFAWHAANTTRFAAPLLLGMHPETVGDFHRASIDRLPHLAAVEAVNLTARWSSCAAYWRALTTAAAEPHPARLKRIQLYGLQLAAAARLP
jgi:hypothetical protein